VTVSAKIVLDSIGPCCVRLTTMQLRFPDYIQPEVATHRMFSRNASSSRAIPVEKMIEAVRDDVAIPQTWGKNQRGMQADENVDESSSAEACAIWCSARDHAVGHTRALLSLGIHKQLSNRLLRPFIHTSIVLTGVDTAFGNFFALRCHKMAEPTMQLLAWAMADAYYASKPNVLRAGEWHLPYVTDPSTGPVAHPRPLVDHIKASVARAARVSYLNHDGTNPDYDKDIELHERLVGSVPLHASPAEHQAQAWDRGSNLDRTTIAGNFVTGWTQYRKTLKGECATFDYDKACKEQR